VTVEVRDDGPGIPAAHLPHVFDRFYKADRSRSARGSGLGLAISRHIVEAHGGRISARQAPEGGAEIVIVLPKNHA
jgi:two-component system sensor histidine kinase BaeS